MSSNFQRLPRREKATAQQPEMTDKLEGQNLSFGHQSTVVFNYVKELEKLEKSVNDESSHLQNSTRPSAVQVPNEVQQKFSANRSSHRRQKLPRVFLVRNALLAVTDGEEAEFEAKVVNGIKNEVPPPAGKNRRSLLSKSYPDFSSLKYSTQQRTTIT